MGRRSESKAGCILKTIGYTTTNEGKFRSLQSALESQGIHLVQRSLELPELRSDDVVSIAKHKATDAFAQLREPVIASDAGFYIPALAGFPKTYVNVMLRTIGIEGLLKLMEGKERQCEFLNCLAFLDVGLSEPKCFIERYAGTLSQEPRGEHCSYMWSELSLIFIPEGEDRTLAEMDAEEYRSWAATARAKAGVERELACWILSERCENGTAT